MFYSKNEYLSCNKYFSSCILDFKLIKDPYTYSNCTVPINVSYLHSPRDFWEKYKYEKSYLCRNMFYQSYRTQVGNCIPNTNDMPILNENGEHCYIKNGRHIICSINVSASLNMPISNEYRSGILSLFVPEDM